MKKKAVLLCGFLLGAVLGGCGVKTTPEIIMPEEPLVSSMTVAQPTASIDSESVNTAPLDSGAQDSSSTRVSSGENYTVYLITMDLTDSYWKSIDDGCLEAANELGNITYRWAGPDAHDDALQSACVDDAVANGADAILIAANSAEGINGSLQNAAASGCKIVYVDSAASYDCVTALSTDNIAAGKTAGQTMLQSLQAKGITSGTIAVFGVTADTASCVAREEGFRSAFAGTDFTLPD